MENSTITLTNLIENCKRFSKSLNGTIVSNEEVIKWFKSFCKSISDILLYVHDIIKGEKLDQHYRDVLILYCTQLLTSLSLLINIFVKESEVQLPITEGRTYALKQVVWCLTGIENTLLNVQDNKNSSLIIDQSGNFINWMDSALDKIMEINLDLDKEELKQIFNEAKQLFEEVLCHAMSIAQVATVEDCKMLKGSSQMVLESLDSLTNEINKPNPNRAMVNLFIDVCCNKLCSLESKVNITVLRLSLKVFSQFTNTLDEIDSFCLNSNNRDDKLRMNQLDSLVADFDLHVDQIMQIGLFAVSCSTCFSRCTKIRSCLASLEALETELVPAFTAIMIDRQSLHNVNYAMVLRNHWVHQAFTLQQLIYDIIDPFAFCQVIYEECKNIVDELNESVTFRKEVLEITPIEQLANNAKVLKLFIYTIFDDVEQNVINTVKSILNDFKAVLHEVSSAAHKLLIEQENTLEGSSRVLKRCKILLSTIKRLWYCFVDDENEIVIQQNKNEAQSDKTERCQQMSNKFMDMIIERGQQILKDRSVLYRSPIKNQNFTNKSNLLRKDRKQDISLSKLVHLRKLNFLNSMIKKEESSIDLQITDMLNELTHLSNIRLQQ